MVTPTDDSVRAHFDLLADRWARLYRDKGPFQGRVQRYLQILGTVESVPARVLDFGCGSGDIANALAEAGYKVSGVDISEPMIRQCCSRFSQSTVTFAKVDSRGCLPFRDGTQDVCIASSVFEYLNPVAPYLRELHRVVREKGWLIASVPNSRHPIRIIEGLELGIRNLCARKDRWQSYRTEYLSLSGNRYSLGTWKRMCKSTGWSVLSVEARSRPLSVLVAQRVNQ